MIVLGRKLFENQSYYQKGSQGITWHQIDSFIVTGIYNIVAKEEKKPNRQLGLGCLMKRFPIFDSKSEYIW